MDFIQQLEGKKTHTENLIKRWSCCTIFWVCILPFDVTFQSFFMMFILGNEKKCIHMKVCILCTPIDSKFNLTSYGDVLFRNDSNKIVAKKNHILTSRLVTLVHHLSDNVDPCLYSTGISVLPLQERWWEYRTVRFGTWCCSPCRKLKVKACSLWSPLLLYTPTFPFLILHDEMVNSWLVESVTVKHLAFNIIALCCHPCQSSLKSL